MKIKNKRGQVTFELSNGELANLNSYAKRLIKTQDLQAWKSEPEAFKVWIATNVATYIKNLTVKFTLPKSA